MTTTNKKAFSTANTKSLFVLVIQNEPLTNIYQQIYYNIN